MYYFQKYFGDQMISSSISGSSQIMSYASTFTSGQIGIAIVNKSTTAQTVGVNFQNFVPGTRYYWYTLSGSNDNGEFSHKVSVNGVPATYASGGPSDYATIKPNSALCNNDVKVTVPDRSAVFILIERNSSTTAVPAVNEVDKMIHLFNNPSKDGSFTLKFEGFTAADQFEIKMMDAAGKAVYYTSVKNIQLFNLRKQFARGIYFISIQTRKGSTVKKLIVD
jgi:hypothetical protein